MNKDAILAKLKQYPVAIGGFVLALLLGAALYLRSGNIVSLTEELNSLDSTWSAMEKNRVQSSDLSEQLKKLEAVSKEIDARLMLRTQKPINYQYFYQLEQSTGINLGTLNQSDAPPGNKLKLSRYSPIDYTLGAVGTYPQLLKFLQSMEHGKFFVRVESFSCTGGSGSEVDQLRINLKMNVLGTK